jgi:hypothetical protein
LGLALVRGPLENWPSYPSPREQMSGITASLFLTQAEQRGRNSNAKCWDSQEVPWTAGKRWTNSHSTGGVSITAVRSLEDGGPYKLFTFSDCTVLGSPLCKRFLTFTIFKNHIIPKLLILSSMTSSVHVNSHIF